MSTLEVSSAEPRVSGPGHTVVNDFSIQVATVNGSGSQTANTVLMRSILQMGVPVPARTCFHPISGWWAEVASIRRVTLRQRP